MTLPGRIARSLAALAGVAAILVLAAGSALAKDEDVHIDKLTFSPNEVTVSVGDTVTWEVTNAVPEGHTVTSGAPDGSDIGAEFDSGIGLDANGQTFEHTFDTAGTFPYFCKVHGAAMSGTVTVLDAGSSEEPAASEAPAASEPPAASEAPSGEPPAASEEPAATPGPTPLLHPTESAQVPSDRRLLAGGVLFVAIVIMFAGAAVWRRLNPA